MSIFRILTIIMMVLSIMPGITWASAIASATDGNGTVTIGTLSFQTSPNVYIGYASTDTHASYTAGSVNSQGNKAYGVDADFTGMYVKDVASGTTDPGIPAASAGSSTEFPTNNWSVLGQ